MSNFWQPKFLLSAALAVALAICTAFSFAVGPIEAKAPEPRTNAIRVVFPNDVSLGNLTLLDKNWTNGDAHPRGPSFGQARGSLILPPDKSLMIRFFDTIEEHLDGLNNLPKDSVSCLDFEGTGVGDKVVSAIQKVKSLESVRRIILQDTEVTDKSVTMLANFKNLETLNLQSTNVRGTTISALLPLPKFFAFDIGCNDLEKKSFDALSELTRLVQLNLCRTGFDDAAALKIVKLKNLSRLIVSDNLKFTDKGLAYLQALPRLTHIDLRNTGVTAAGIMKWKNSKTLRTITFNRGQFSTAAEREFSRGMNSVRFRIEDRREQSPEGLFAPLK